MRSRTAALIIIDMQKGMASPADACFAFAKADYAGTPRSADDVHAMALSNLDGEYATVVSTGAVLDAFDKVE